MAEIGGLHAAAPLNAALHGLEKRGQAGPDEARISDQATLGEAELSLSQAGPATH